MSLHEDIAQAIRAAIDQSAEAIDVSPTLVANLTYGRFGSAADEPHTKYAAVEHIKAMARAILAKKFEPEGDENAAHQGDMFSGLLQQKYPIRRQKGDEPMYRPLEALSLSDLDFNVRQLMRSADARVQHAQALQAYRDRKIKEAA